MTTTYAVIKLLGGDSPVDANKLSDELFNALRDHPLQKRHQLSVQDVTVIPHLFEKICETVSREGSIINFSNPAEQKGDSTCRATASAPIK